MNSKDTDEITLLKFLVNSKQSRFDYTKAKLEKEQAKQSEKTDTSINTIASKYTDWLERRSDRTR